MLKEITPPGSFVSEFVDTETGEAIRCHLTTGPARVVVPAAERHKWNRTPVRGQVDTCTYCKVKRCTRLDGSTAYRYGSGPIQRRRPACTGRPPASS